jgi:predicted lipoprotein with Yx(FWY)xxD motif
MILRKRMPHVLVVLAALLFAAAVAAVVSTPQAFSARPAQQSAALVQVRIHPTYVSILTDSSGNTLYELTSEAGGNFHCTGGCLSFWPPFTLPSGVTTPTAGPGVAGTLGTISRPGDGTQVTDNGFPLYYFKNDKAPGDTNGQGIMAFGGEWHVVAAVSTPLAATPVERITTSITTTGGTVWGRLTLRYAYQHRLVQHTCARTTCQFLVPFGVQVHLSQTPTHAATWPFKQWQISEIGMHTKSRISHATATSLKVTSGYTVKAVYVVG